MAEVAFWEQQLVDKFVIKAKRERYLRFLKGPKHRKKILQRLNHAFDYDPKCAIAISSADRNKQGLLMLLRDRYVKDTRYLIADGNHFDGRELRLEVGIDELIGNHWGRYSFVLQSPSRYTSRKILENGFYWSSEPHDLSGLLKMTPAKLSLPSFSPLAITPSGKVWSDECPGLGTVSWHYSCCVPAAA
jgi:hypothetical protein